MKITKIAKNCWFLYNHAWNFPDLGSCHKNSQQMRKEGCPATKTIVLRHYPVFSRRRSEEMKSLDSRKKIPQCYEAFKPFVDVLESGLKV